MIRSVPILHIQKKKNMRVKTKKVCKKYVKIYLKINEYHQKWQVNLKNIVSRKIRNMEFENVTAQKSRKLATIFFRFFWGRFLPSQVA